MSNILMDAESLVAMAMGGDMETLLAAMQATMDVRTETAKVHADKGTAKQDFYANAENQAGIAEEIAKDAENAKNVTLVVVVVDASAPEDGAA